MVDDDGVFHGLVADQPEGEADKIGAKVISHSRYVAFKMAEVAIPRQLLANNLRLIAEMRPPPDPTLA